jgi:GGDEF domain-containing protein
MFSQSRSQSNKSGQAPAPRSVRLPKQSIMPNYQDIQFLHTEVNKGNGRQVEMPFSVTEGSQEYLLSVKVDRSISMDPIWTFSIMSPKGQQVLFSTAEGDISLVANLVMSGAGCDPLSDAFTSDGMMGMDTMGNLSTVTAQGSAELPTITNSAIEPTVLFDAPKPGMKATLEGDLTKMQAPNLLQSITMAKMTGRLDCKDKNENAKLYFSDGTLVHAEIKDTVGDEAVIDFITWTAGEFRFWPDEKTGEKTVNRRLEAMLMEGVTMLDQVKYLESANLKPESCLVKRNAIISEQEFAQRITKGAPIGLQPQLDVYEQIDNRSSLADILRKVPMKKTEWVPIMFNLLTCGLVQVTDQQISRSGSMRSVGIDEATLQSVTKHLIRPESGIMTFPAFLYFLDQEYLRYEYFNFPFSLIVFSLGNRQGSQNGPVEALQMLAVKRAMQRISLVKRPIDLIGHYEMFDYAVLLPNSNVKAAAALAHRIVDVLREAPLTADLDPRSLVFAFGVAGVPEDCQELDKLLQFAKNARDASKQSNRIVLAREVIGS